MNNEKGITLVELLAAISILLIISPLLYSVLISANKSFSQISAKSNLEQEANLITSTINSYQQGGSSYHISYDSGTAYIGTDTPDHLLGNEKIIENIEINGTTIGKSPNEDADIDPNIIKSITVKITLNNHQGDTFVIDTIIKRY